MGIRVSTITLRKQSKHLRDTTSFPISEYDKYLLKSSWGMLANKQLRFGIGLFYRLFTLRPDIAPKFTEFGEMESAEELKTWTELKGHPKKLAYAFNLAISCLDDANDFITKIESLGEKHLRKLKSEDMQIMGKALIDTVQDLLPEEECNKDVINAWYCLYQYICKLFRESMQKAKQRSLYNANLESGSETTEIEEK